jgi:Holliday junction DNA helicase RuvB
MNAVSSIDTLYNMGSGSNEMKEVDNEIQGIKMVKDTQAIQETAKTMKQIDFRPQTFDQVIGQTEIKEFLKLKIAAFKKTRVSLVHTLFLGFSGVGKTTLANVVANEMGVTCHQVMATRIKTWDDFYNIIKNIEENDILFIDEIHALAPKIQEHLYGVMEDFTCTIHDKNLNRQILRRLPRFTLIGATTHSGDLNPPLLSRFQYKANLLPYSTEDLTTMITTAGERIYDISVPYDVANRLAQLSRRTARIAYSLLRSLMDVAEAQTTGKVTPDMLTKPLMNKMLRYEQIDPIIGLDYASRKYIVALLRESGALGSKTIANYINEQESTVTGMIEPFLFSEIELESVDNGSIKVQKGPFVRITKKGRIASVAAYHYIKLCHSLQKQGWFTNESLNVKPE